MALTWVGDDVPPSEHEDLGPEYHWLHPEMQNNLDL